MLAKHQGDFVASRAYYEEALAIRRELGDRHRVALSLRSLGHTTRFQGDFMAARACYEEALAICRESGNRHGVANMLANLGCLARDQCDYAAARAHLEEALARFREIASQRGASLALTELGHLAMEQGEHAAAHSHFEEALALLQGAGDHEVAGCFVDLGCLATERGDFVAARAHFEEALARCRELGDKRGLARALLCSGDLARKEGDRRRARRLYEECLAVERELGNRGEAILGALANLAADEGDHVEARRLWGMSLAERQQIGHFHTIAGCLEGFAYLCSKQGQAERAAQLLGAAEGLREAVRSSLPLRDRADHECAASGARAALGEEAFARAWAEGQAMTREQAVAQALATGPFRHAHDSRAAQRHQNGEHVAACSPFGGEPCDEASGSAC
jgi:tetratricopeptide (TPR) repeat protein